MSQITEKTIELAHIKCFQQALGEKSYQVLLMTPVALPQDRAGAGHNKLSRSQFLELDSIHDVLYYEFEYKSPVII